MNKKYEIFILFVLFFLSCTKSKHLNNLKSSDIDSLDSYISLANDTKLSNIERNQFYLKAYNIVEGKKNDSISRNKLLEISIGFFNNQKWDGFNKSINLLLKNCIESKDRKNLAQVYRYKAGYFKNNSSQDSAFYFYLKSEKLFKSLNDYLNLGNVLSNKSIVQYSAGDYVGADKSLTEAYKLLMDLNESEKLFIVFTMMGVIANETKDYDKAIEYYGKSLKIVRSNNLTTDFQEATCLNNIGYVYQNKGDYNQAIKIYKQALLDKTILNGAPDLYSLLIDNLAYSKYKLKDFKGLPSKFFEALKVRESINDPTLIVLSKIHLSEYYATEEDSVSSQKYASEALSLAKSTKITRDILASLRQASNVDHKKSSKYSKDYIRISDSIQEVERKSQERFSRLQLETDEIIQQKDKLTEQNRTLLYFFIGTLFVGLLLFVIRTQRAKNRELLLKQQQQKANEEIYNLMISQQATIEENRVKEKKRIAQELHDGVLGRLFGARLNLDSLNRFSDDESINSRFNYLSELKNIEQDIREISHDLNREKYVLINNFVAIVSNLLEEQESSFEAEVTSSIDEKIKWETLNNTAKINLYRILQESLQNINKYANAKSIHVEFKTDDESIILKISDDGNGFDVNTKKRGIGLQNMVSRANECDGVFDVKSKKGKGTTIMVTIPLVKKPVEV